MLANFDWFAGPSVTGRLVVVGIGNNLGDIGVRVVSVTKL
jgi:hypothetical protein